jgi:hypothetical protein
MSVMTKHLQLLVDTGKQLKAADGARVNIFELKHTNDNSILSAWAKHFRNHYCLDTEIDILRHGTGYSRRDYLIKLKFPDAKAAPGPSIRAGDFGEILVADFVQYLLDYWVPRTHYADKSVRNESKKGSDIVGFKLVSTNASPKDSLIIFEAKARLTGNSPVNRLQDAVDDSVKDRVRKAESLNAIKQRLLEKGKIKKAQIVERFQNKTDKPYLETSGAAAVVSNKIFDAKLYSKTKTNHHPNSSRLMLIIIRGDDMMTLVNELFRRAADES